MAKLSKSEVEKIAELARIKLSEKEKEKFSFELSEILDYVEKINKAHNKDIPATSQVTGLKNILRADKATEITHPEKDKNQSRIAMLKNAPSQQDGYIKVRAVLE